MGGCVSKKNNSGVKPGVSYCVFLGPKTLGKTQILRSPAHAKSLFTTTEEGFSTVWEILEFGFQRYRDSRLFGTRTNEGYTWVNYGQVEPLVRKFGSALNRICPVTTEGLTCVGILAKNRPEWVIADFACTLYGRVTVPLYDTLGSQAMVHILKETSIQVVICSMEACEKILKLHSEEHFPSLKRLVLMDPPSAAVSGVAQTQGIELLTMENVYTLGEQVQPIVKSRSEDVFTICYTSGTTGEPKGVQITHKNMVAGLMSLKEKMHSDSTDIRYSFLPAAHMFERNSIYLYFYAGTSSGFSSGNPMKLFEDLSVLKPTHFGSVPRLFKRLHDMIKLSISALAEPLKKETETAIAEKIERLHRTADFSDQNLDAKYFTETRAKLGGNVRFCVSGGSAIAKDVLEFLKVTLCCPIIEGYGQTEVPGSICITNPTDLECGHVGGPVGGVEITLQDVPDLGYFSSAHSQRITNNPSGEICVRGPNVFIGYYKAPQLTKEAFDAEGWLHTGDIGELLSSGAIKIIDRKKSLFKLSQGEYISPERVEQTISNCPFVAQCWVHGETVQDFLIAFIVPEEPACMKWAKTNNIDGDFNVLATSEELKDFLLTQIKTICIKSGLTSLECPKKIKVVNQPFGVEQGLITPTLKLRRAALKQNFAQEIKELYAS